MDFDRCSELSNNKIITASENRMKFIIKNINHFSIRKVIVDGCLINDDRQRCDYLFEIHNPLSSVIYLELKGCDVKKAVQQLESTMRICSQRHWEVQKRSCYIVASRVPKIGTKIQVLKKKFLKKSSSTVYPYNESRSPARLMTTIRKGEF